jgi:hypothetical protein
LLQAGFFAHFEHTEVDAGTEVQYECAAAR